jgi:hypothetical protein
MSKESWFKDYTPVEVEPDIPENPKKNQRPKQNNQRNNPMKTANPRKIKTIILIGLFAVTIALAVSGFLPTLINIALTPWEWFFREMVFQGRVDALSKIPFLGGLAATYRFAYLSLFWICQAVQCTDMILKVTGTDLPKNHRETLTRLRNTAYAIELGVNVLFGWNNPYGTDDTWVIYRIIATLLFILAQTFSFEWTLKFLLEAMGVFFGGVWSSVKPAKDGGKRDAEVA